MQTNWKERLKKESSHKLFEIFSETERINIEPQLFAGNLLHERDYDINELRNAKYNLIACIEESFKNKYILDPKKNRKENIVRELTLRVLFVILIFSLFYFVPEFEYNYDNLTININAIFYTLIALNFLPLLWLRKSNEKSIKRAEREYEKKNNLIVKINTELRF